METKNELAIVNEMHVNLNQATLGLGENFRMVSFMKENDCWSFNFYLYRDDPHDREEIEDIVTQIEALEGANFKARVEVIVGSEPIEWPAAPARVVFRKNDNR